MSYAYDSPFDADHRRLSDLPPGKYVVGDPFEFLSREDSRDLVEKMNEFDRYRRDGKYELNSGTIVGVASVPFDAGRFEDYRGRRYFTESRLLGCVPADVAHFDESEDAVDRVVVDFPKKFRVEIVNDDAIRFGDVLRIEFFEAEEEEEEEGEDDDEDSEYVDEEDEEIE